LPRRFFRCEGSGCGAFKVLGRIVGRRGSPFSRLISSRIARISARCSSMTRSKRSTNGVRSAVGTSIPATVIGSIPSMPNKKHQNHPPSKDQFHGIIENLPAVCASSSSKNTAIPRDVLLKQLRYNKLYFAYSAYLRMACKPSNGGAECE